MRVLGIDPAAAGATGFGVIETGPRAPRLACCGAERPARNATPCERLRAVHRLVTRLLAEYAPDAVALEGVFAALNVRTALRLAEVRGVVMLAAAEAGVPVFDYPPREVKLAITGYGHADKRQVQQMVRAELKLAAAPQPADAADALAVALCHLHAERARARASRSTGDAGLAALLLQKRNGARRRNGFSGRAALSKLRHTRAGVSRILLST